MTSIGDSFGWPFQDPGWFGKIVVQGLIFIIPIVGWIALAGWVIMLIDNYRAGRRELPPAGFHLERGVALFVVVFVYDLVLSLPGDIISLGASSGSSRSSLGGLVGFLFGLLFAFIAPALYLQTYRRGFNGGFDIGGVWAMATGNINTTFIAALMFIVAVFIGAIGFCLLFVGLIFTIPFSAAITAGIVTWYDQQLSGQPQLPPQPAQ